MSQRKLLMLGLMIKACSVAMIFGAVFSVVNILNPECQFSVLYIKSVGVTSLFFILYDVVNFIIDKNRMYIANIAAMAGIAFYVSDVNMIIMSGLNKLESAGIIAIPLILVSFLVKKKVMARQ